MLQVPGFRYVFQVFGVKSVLSYRCLVLTLCVLQAFGAYCVMLQVSDVNYVLCYRCLVFVMYLPGAWC